MALGMKLKQAREAMGLSESDLAESTHMMAQMIREIEAEDYHRFSAPIYGKGFIKLYAKAVGLDPAPLVSEFMAAMAGNSDKASKPPHVALEAIDKHSETGISIVTPEVPETPEESTSPAPPAPPAPTPRHVYAKASTVTMPNTDSPHPMPEPTRPPPKLAPASVEAPAPLQAPASVQADASAHPPAVEPPAAESAPAAPAGPTAGDGFRLEAEPAVSVAPPQPVAASVRPFQYPMPKQAARPAPAPAPDRDEDDEDEDSFVERPTRRRAPRRNRQRPSLGLAEAFRNWTDKAREYVAELRENPEADDEDAGPLGDATPSRRRWWIGGVAAAVVVLTVLLLSNKGGDETGGASIPDEPEVVEGGVEPIADEVEAIVETPVAAVPEPVTPAPASPMAPTEIVRVLPPPKCFAR